MSIARHLATIDALCAREFPVTRGTADLGTGGPGYHIVEFASEGDQDEPHCVLRDVAEEQVEAERDGLSARLDERWGTAQVLNLGGLLLRAMEYGEDIPEPWAHLGALASDAYAWHTGSRWIALAVARLDPARHPALLLAVTEIDPP